MQQQHAPTPAVHHPTPEPRPVVGLTQESAALLQAINHRTLLRGVLGALETISAGGVGETASSTAAVQKIGAYFGMGATVPQIRQVAIEDMVEVELSIYALSEKRQHTLSAGLVEWATATWDAPSPVIVHHVTPHAPRPAETPQNHNHNHNHPEGPVE